MPGLPKNMDLKRKNNPFLNIKWRRKRHEDALPTFRLNGIVVPRNKGQVEWLTDVIFYSQFRLGCKGRV